MNEKVLSCGCILMITGNQLGNWKKVNENGISKYVVCGDHALAAFTAQTRRAFPIREAGTMPIAARNMVAQTRYANEMRPNMADKIVNDFWERALGING